MVCYTRAGSTRAARRTGFDHSPVGGASAHHRTEVRKLDHESP
jgi:hypothetical protein